MITYRLIEEKKDERIVRFYLLSWRDNAEWIIINFDLYNRWFIFHFFIDYFFSKSTLCLTCFILYIKDN
jgi:hypothetical protein